MEEIQFDNFKGVFLKGKSINTDTAICFDVTDYVKDKSFDKIICANFTSPTGMIAIRYMKAHHIKYWLESDGGFAKSGEGIKEKIKKHFISGANGYFSTCDECDAYYIKYGADSRKLIRYPFTSLYESDILPQLIKNEEKTKIKAQLGMSESNIVLAVGQFIPRKGFDVLLKAANNLPKEIGVYFIGGVPTDEYLAYQKENELTNVHFVGYIAKSELALYYKAANIFVLPTREDIWGLVINEAMAFGLPVISTDRCAAARTLVADNRNGYIVPADNEYTLTERMMALLFDFEKQFEFANQSLNVIRNYTIEKMAARHIDVLR